MEVDSLERGRPSKITTIQFKPLDGPRPRPLTILKLWEHGDNERTLFDAFMEKTQWQKKWASTPCYFNAGFEKRLIWDRMVRYGYVPAFSDPHEYEKPHIDLHQIALLMNADRPFDPEDHGVPSMFKGSRLSDFSAKRLNGADAARFYQEGRLDALLHYIQVEAEAFEALFESLAKHLPRLFRETIGPELGLKGVVK